MIGIIKVLFSSVLNRLEITSKYNNFHTIDFSRKRLFLFLELAKQYLLHRLNIVYYNIYYTHTQTVLLR